MKTGALMMTDIPSPRCGQPLQCACGGKTEWTEDGFVCAETKDISFAVRDAADLLRFTRPGVCYVTPLRCACGGKTEWKEDGFVCKNSRQIVLSRRDLVFSWVV